MNVWRVAAAAVGALIAAAGAAVIYHRLRDRQRTVQALDEKKSVDDNRKSAEDNRCKRISFNRLKTEVTSALEFTLISPLLRIVVDYLQFSHAWDTVEHDNISIQDDGRRAALLAQTMAYLGICSRYPLIAASNRWTLRFVWKPHITIFVGLVLRGRGADGHRNRFGDYPLESCDWVYLHVDDYGRASFQTRPINWLNYCSRRSIQLGSITLDGHTEIEFECSPQMVSVAKFNGIRPPAPQPLFVATHPRFNRLSPYFGVSLRGTNPPTCFDVEIQ